MSDNSATIPSMQTVKVLAPDEFSILDQAPDKVRPDARFVTAIVAEREGRLLGRRFLCLVPHIEGAWQLPECDVSAIENEVKERIREMRLTGVMRAAPINEDLTSQGYEPLPMLLWVKRS